HADDDRERVAVGLRRGRPGPACGGDDGNAARRRLPRRRLRRDPARRGPTRRGSFFFALKVGAARGAVGTVVDGPRAAALEIVLAEAVAAPFAIDDLSTHKNPIRSLCRAGELRRLEHVPVGTVFEGLDGG